MLKKLGILAVLLAIGGFLFYKFYIMKPVSNVNDLKADFTTDYKSLTDEINKNDTVAAAKYTDKVMLITGVVTGMEPFKDKDGKDSAYSITVGDSTGTNDVSLICQVDTRNIETAKNVAVAKQIKIKGKVTGIDNQRNAKVEEGFEEFAEQGGVTFQLKDCTVENK